MDFTKINTLELDTNAQIINVLSNNIDVVGKISGFQIAVDRLNSNQKKLVDLNAQLIKDPDNIEKTKNESRNNLVKIVSPVITILQIFAFDKKRKNLLKQLESLSNEFLQNCSDIELVNISKQIWKTANKFGGYSLAYILKTKSSLNSGKLKAVHLFEKEYGLIPDMIKNIEGANIKFIETLLIYKEELSKKEKIIRKIKKISNKNSKLLINKIDRFVVLCADTNSEFYRLYYKAREHQLFGNSLENEVDTEESMSDMTVADSPKQSKRSTSGKLKTAEM